ncbi:hypothetical protein D3093_19035 (plasmid) [Azospirillum argentinense]|uniref:Uncharacterized protein n=1 Tax=Azospirillum argentinense TaxID=2970906 RepID=A0A4D8PFB5_9PROT|nr:hypothetical protein D3093_19035 [Azospirillum argentinense]
MRTIRRESTPYTARTGCKPLSRPGRGWPEGPGEGLTRINAPLLAYTLTLPTLRAGPFPLPGRERVW